VFKGWYLALASILIIALFLLNAGLLATGYLPEPLMPAVIWPKVEVIFLFSAGIIVMVCTRGMSQLAHEKMDSLQGELDTNKKHLSKINHLKIKAESSTQSKTMFLATMSHELRTPLNSMIGNAQLLAKEKLPGATGTRIEDISLAGRLLLTLINDVLDFSKLEQNKLAFVETTYDINGQIHNLCRMMETRAKQGVKLNICLPEKNIFIHGDQSRLAQVIMNLLSNGFKFTDTGSVTIRLHDPSDDPNNKDLEISVMDTGTGIKDTDMKNLFKQFSQLADDSAKNIEGSGLGLSICKGIVEQMGGKISATSEYGKGSCFTVLLPNRMTENTPTSKTGSHQDTQHLSLHDIPMLIVDDIQMNCIVLEGILEEFSANKIGIVNSGIDAIHFIKASPHTRIIYMDMRMPKMDGLTATQEIRKLGYQGIIVAVTANVTAENQADCLAAGMDYFLPKPLEINDLKTLLLKFV
jgi:signal transduction histidine kinase/CheY-like chemotaxis protein